MIKKEKVNSVIPASHVGGCCELSAVVTEALNGNPAQPQVQFYQFCPYKPLVCFPVAMSD